MPDRHLIQVVNTVLTQRTEGLVCTYLFGSHVRGDTVPESDVDVAVLFE